MKNLVYYILLLVLVASCSPEEYNVPANLTPEDIEWGYQETDVTNEYFLYNNTPGVTSLWDFGNGVKAKGDSVYARYTFAGEYDIQLTVISQGGLVTVNRKISTENDNPSFLSGYPYDQLTGGDELTWAVDGYSKGAFGLGPTLGNPTEWHADAANAREGKGLYDDRFTFKITGSGLTLVQETNGDVYANGGWAAELGTTDGYQEPDGGDFIMPHDGGTFTVSAVDNKLNVLGGGFMGYYAGASEYTIITLEDDLLEVAFWDSKAGFYWFTRFRPVDKLTPKPEPVVKEYTAKDIMDDFEGNGNIVWHTADAKRFATISNFAVTPVDTSENIAIYEKAAFEWTNVKTVLDFRMDLSERNVFSMKVFMPNFNDYETACNPGTDWLTEHNLKPQVDVKLQNSLLEGNAWTTQEVRGHLLSSDQLGRWVELEFDFSDVPNRDDFDQIIIQLGAEGHCNSGTFYIDEFKLK